MIVDDPEQIGRLYIPNTVAYCTVDMEKGTVCYYKQEENHG